MSSEGELPLTAYDFLAVLRFLWQQRLSRAGSGEERRDEQHYCRGAVDALNEAILPFTDSQHRLCLSPDARERMKIALEQWRKYKGRDPWREGG